MPKGSQWGRRYNYIYINTNCKQVCEDMEFSHVAQNRDQLQAVCEYGKKLEFVKRS